MTIETINYQTNGTCCALIQVKVEDNIIVDVNFLGGCQGNLQGIKSLVTGMSIDNVISKLEGIKCGSKTTSCPDQLARCLTSYRVEKSHIVG